MSASFAAVGVGGESRRIQRRLAVYQVQLLTLVGLPLTLVFFASTGWWRYLDAIQAVAILGGALPLGLLDGFLRARRISAKCGALGVFRRKGISEMSVRSVMLVLVAVLLPISVFLYISLYLLFSGSVVIPLSTLAAFDVGLFLAALGFGLPVPLGIIWFERRMGFRLWIIGSPSLWFPYRIEFRQEAIGVRPLVT